MVQVAKASGEGVVEYHWSKSGTSKSVPKVSFVKLIPEWGWVIGAGLYLDDVQAELSGVLYRALGVVATAILLVLLLAFFMARSISVPMGKTVHMLEGMGKGNLENRLKLSRTDEIGRLATVMDAFTDNLQDEILTAFQRLADGDFPGNTARRRKNTFSSVSI